MLGPSVHDPAPKQRTVVDVILGRKLLEDKLSVI